MDAATRPADLQYNRVVKRFDFDERGLGNFESTPMRWVQLTGPGLPPYSRGEFDEQLGHTGAPSFRLHVQTGNVAYEYRGDDIPVVPFSDYLITAAVRTNGVRHSRAFVAAHLVDRYHERIPGTDRISALVSDAGDHASWTPVQIAMPVNSPDAQFLRLQLWVLHTHVWEHPTDPAAASIEYHDVKGLAWFDDILVYHLPRIELRLSNPSGLVSNAGETLIVTARSTTRRPLRAEISILGPDGPVAKTEHDLQFVQREAFQPPGLAPAESDAPLRQVSAPLRELPPGRYLAELRLFDQSDLLTRRALNFVVLPEAPTPIEEHEFGFTLLDWLPGDAAGLRDLLTEVGCRHVRLGLGLLGLKSNLEEPATVRQTQQILRELGTRRIEAGAILLPWRNSHDSAEPLSTVQATRSADAWSPAARSLLSQTAGMFSYWQLGDEAFEARDPNPWTASSAAEVVKILAGYMTVPDVVAPRSSLDEGDPLDMPTSIHVPSDVPAIGVPTALDELREPANRARWVMLEPPDLGPGRNSQAIIDLARRVILAKAAGPDRVFLRPPFALNATGGVLAWQPDETYLPLRTLMHCLSGRQFVNGFAPGADAIGLVFERDAKACLALWTWNEAGRATAELYLGPRARAFNLWGQRLELHEDAGRYSVPLRSAPTLIVDIDARLLQLQNSIQLEPRHVPPYDVERRPKLSFINPYDSTLWGDLHIEAVPGWSVTPTHLPVTLRPGEMFEQELTLSFPPRQTAAQQPLTIRLKLREPATSELVLSMPISVGLEDVVIQASAYWSGEDLVVEQTVENLGQQPLSFTAFCQAPRQARQERAFLHVKRGDESRREYIFRNARSLVGATVHLGIQQIGGPRRLEQALRVPPIGE